MDSCLGIVSVRYCWGNKSEISTVNFYRESHNDDCVSGKLIIKSNGVWAC